MDAGTGGRESIDDAVRAFCDTEYARVVAYCRRLVGDEQLAHDLTQEAMVRVFGRWFQVRDVRAYVYVVATNLCRGVWRERRDERVAFERLGPPRDEPVEGPDIGVRDVVDRLPRRWRDLVLLHYYADLSVSEIARQVGEPEGTVKRRLGEARRLLAGALEGVR